MICNIFQDETVTNELEAYLLGFFYADGCVSNNIFSVALSERDVDFLQWILDVLNSELNSNYTLKYNKNTASYRFQICNRHFVNNIMNLGVVPNKTYENSDFIFQNVPDVLKRHFIRGYFDGDGCVLFAASSNKWVGNIVSLNEMLIRSIHGYCVQYIGCGTVRRDRTYFRFCLSGNGAMLRFGDMIYRDAQYFLNRKKEKFDNIMICEKRNVYAGISKHHNKYRVSIYSKPNKKQLYLGLRDTVESAINLYNEYSDDCQQLRQTYRGDDIYYE